MDKFVNKGGAGERGVCPVCNEGCANNEEKPRKLKKVAQ
jgi:hypothetical protein